MDKDKTCATCKWWRDSDRLEAGLGECRIHLPKVVAWGTCSIEYRVWPRVRTTDWCGEHTPKAKDQPDE